MHEVRSVDRAHTRNTQSPIELGERVRKNLSQWSNRKHRKVTLACPASNFDSFQFEQEPPAIKFVHRVVLLPPYVFAYEVSSKPGDHGGITASHSDYHRNQRLYM